MQIVKTLKPLDIQYPKQCLSKYVPGTIFTNTFELGLKMQISWPALRSMDSETVGSY